MSEQFKAASIRALIGLIASALVIINSYLIGEVAGRIALGAFALSLVPVISRLGEGLYDSNRQSSGNVQPGDVRA